MAGENTVGREGKGRVSGDSDCYLIQQGQELVLRGTSVGLGFPQKLNVQSSNYKETTRYPSSEYTILVAKHVYLKQKLRSLYLTCVF